jgi:anthranilate synthase component 1
MRPTVDRAGFVALASRYSIVPVAVEVLGDRETAVSAFEKLVGDGPGFLLESVEGGERWARWSFAGWDPLFTLSARDGRSWVEGASVDVPSGDPLDVLEQLITRYTTPALDEVGLGDRSPPLHSGAVGYLAYDAVRYVERLPQRPTDDRGLPEMVWHFVGSLVAVDRYRDTLLLIRNVLVGPDPAEQYDEAVVDLERSIARLSQPRPYVVEPRPGFSELPAATVNMTKESFEEGVVSAIAHIAAGDAFQIVPSLRWEVAFDGDAFRVYRALRLVNPSPFMFFIRHGAVSIAGSSPELMARARDGFAYSRPIAGTRPRGATEKEDAALEQDLLADPKERAEHVMLVDLARNDLGRVCRYGTVGVDDFMVIERYSHVMHIVSGISGELRPNVGPIDVLRATFPHGTVSGAPKVRAMEIIDELEPTARGPYAGAAGYVDFSGNLDTAIALRTLVADGATAWVQAGAGIVADSDPSAEYEECRNKAAAVLAAIAGAAEL